MSLKTEYNEKIRKTLKEQDKYTSMEAVPKIEKIVINMGVGKMRDNKGFIEECLADMTSISGQKPVTRKATVSISNFKLRKGQLAGIMVTLRGDRMWDFYQKLVTVVFPRVKDFRGVTRKYFDGNGNYNIGLREHLVFPEIDANKITYTKPLQITIKTTARTDDQAYSLLKALGMPYRD